MKNQRIYAIHEAATRLFIQQGYSKTQISHIAKAIGVSVGTVYHDFTGKKEIMYFVLKCALEPDFINKNFQCPITEEIFNGLENEIISSFEKSAESFSENIKYCPDNYSFEELISDTFDLLSNYAVISLFIEKNYMDFSSLTQYYRSYRKKFFDAMIKYMNVLIQSEIVRPLKNVELSTTLIIEILSWWTMDMRYISFEQNNISLEQAKEVCMDNIITAYKN